MHNLSINHWFNCVMQCVNDERPMTRLGFGTSSRSNSMPSRQIPGPTPWPVSQCAPGGTGATLRPRSLLVASTGIRAMPRCVRSGPALPVMTIPEPPARRWHGCLWFPYVRKAAPALSPSPRPDRCRWRIQKLAPWGAEYHHGDPPGENMANMTPRAKRNRKERLIEQYGPYC